MTCMLGDQRDSITKNVALHSTVSSHLPVVASSIAFAPSGVYYNTALDAADLSVVFVKIYEHNKQIFI